MSKPEAKVVDGTFQVLSSPEELDRRARGQRVAARLASTKANPTNREIMDAINDLCREIVELKEFIKP